jgi:hypothetical protein
MRNVYKVLDRKCEGKRLHGRFAQRYGLDASDRKYRPLMGSCDDSSGYRKSGAFLD